MRTEPTSKAITVATVAGPSPGGEPPPLYPRPPHPHQQNPHSQSLLLSSRHLPQHAANHPDRLLQENTSPSLSPQRRSPAPQLRQAIRPTPSPPSPHNWHRSCPRSR